MKPSETLRKAKCPVCDSSPKWYEERLDEGLTDYRCDNSDCPVADFSIWWEEAALAEEEPQRLELPNIGSPKKEAL